MRSVKKLFAIGAVIGLFCLFFQGIPNPAIKNYYALQADTLWIKWNIPPTVGNVFAAVDTYGTYVSAPVSSLPVFGNATKDSIGATGGTPSYQVNQAYIITSATTITSASDTFPAGVTGNYIVVVYNQAITTLTNAGTGSGTVTLVAPAKGTSKVYLNFGGNWY